VSPLPRAPALAPFRIRAFRFQWPADLATSWAFEMENLILGWYVLVETGSVLLLTVFASLQYIGTLLAPMFGVIGDRFGHRNLLAGMRAIYTVLATTLMVLAFTGAITPLLVLVVAGLMGLVRPSDIGMRAAVVGDTMPPEMLVGAMGIQRTTQDSARIAGALSGAGLVAALGMGPAYLVVMALYFTSAVLTLKAGMGRAAHLSPVSAASPWRDLKEGLGYVWNAPLLLAVMVLAFLLNLTAFPLMNGLMPYVVKGVYGADQTVLGYMVAGAATGALLSSILLSRLGGIIRPARLTVMACAVWFMALFVFAQMPHPAAGLAVLFFAGCAQSASQVPMAAILLRNAEVRYRGRVMGIRMLAIYGNVPGLLISGPLIAWMGYPLTASIYCVIGLAFTAYIGWRWRAQLWAREAPANSR
jgi:Na+/melibiose symporter-like transporter